MDLFNRKQISNLGKTVNCLGQNLAEQEKRLSKLEKRVNDLEEGLEEITKGLQAIIKYFDFEFYIEWVDDESFPPPPQPKIPVLRVRKKSAKPKKSKPYEERKEN